MAIDRQTGEISVNNPAALDYETQSIFNLDVRVSDTRLSDTVAVRVSLENIPESVVVEDTETTLLGATTIGQSIGELSFMTPDTVSNTTFEIVAGNDPDGDGEYDFQIEENTGKIIVTDDLDFAANFDRYELTVEANNESVINGDSSDIATVAIQLEENFAPTEISLSRSRIAENPIPGSKIGEISVTDANPSDSQELTLVNDAEGAFKLVDNELQVADASLIDFEAASFREVVIRATDIAGESIEKSFEINVRNVFDDPEDIRLTNLLVPHTLDGGAGW